ncbi:uncharacterized protein [Antedon mediterranea]|uniref:uncharacterized protein n=1 Tax=Antedon mediterranea TaxID=105859 RepID=UPI003AF5CF26
MSENRGSNWTYEEVLGLLGIWAEEKIQAQMDGSVRNAGVYRIISDKLLRESGIVRNALQVQRKIKKLKADYKKVADNNKKSGASRKTCKHFEELDAILGSRPEMNPPEIVCSRRRQHQKPGGGGGGGGGENDEPSTSSGSSSTRPSSSSSDTDNDDDDVGLVVEEGTAVVVEPPLPAHQATPPAAHQATPPAAHLATPPATHLATPTYNGRNQPNPKKAKKGKAEQALDAMTKAFLKSEKERDEQHWAMEKRNRDEQRIWEMEQAKEYRLWEEKRKAEREEGMEKRRKEDMDREERMRNQDREHEMRMMSMMCQMFNNSQQQQPSSDQPTYYNM